ncbi:hypothetical protein [Phytopseudomonas daroniae]|uniref:hypothetical protein n=1 Tax=Pseudomonadaceae TaxID=135621 RepID=UPI0010376C47|nr:MULTISPECIES: hypothetical protein [Pseudomonas]
MRLSGKVAHHTGSLPDAKASQLMARPLPSAFCSTAKESADFSSGSRFNWQDFSPLHHSLRMIPGLFREIEINYM